MSKKHYLYVITIFISFFLSFSYAQESSSSSEESQYLGSLCKIPDNLYAPVSMLNGVKQNLYSLMPYISNSDNIYVSDCSCKKDGSFVCTYKNLGLGQGYTPSYVSLCDLREAYWCPQIEKGVCNFTGSSVAIHYSDRYNSSGYTWGAMNFSGTEIMDIENSSQPVYVESSIGTLLFFHVRHVLPQGVTTYELRNAFFEAYPRFPSMDRMNDYCRGEWVPHDENCFGTEQEAILAAEDSTDNCTLGAGIGYYSPKFTEKNGWCAVGNCEGGEFYSSAAESSNSTQLLSSSSYEESSSSSSEGSSSSSTLCEKHPLSSVPDNPNRACFNTNGKCYKCNSDRGSECRNDWLWIYDFNPSNVGYWYTEVDCATGIEKTKDEGIGLCPSHPLTKVPSDPQNACFSSNGKCYKCNSDRGSECRNDWLWIYDFNSSNVGWWYTEVDCYNPNGEDHDGQCPDGSILQKRVANSDNGSKEGYVDYTMELLNTQKYYDVLGRNANRNLKQKRALYRLDRMSNQNSISTEDSEFSERILRLLNEHSSYNTVLRKSESCGVLGGDYGIVEKDGSLTGGITCPMLDTKYTAKYAEIPQNIGVCPDGTPIVDVLVETSLQSYLTSNEYYVVPVNYVFSGNGYRATEEDVRKIKKHELGHVAYNKCIEAKFPNEVEVLLKRFCECESTLQKNHQEWIEPLRQKKYAQDMLRFVRAKEFFHEKYGLFDGADSYVCPSNL